jgi:hypothetical protein
MALDGIDGLSLFARTPIDILIVDNLVISRNF